MFRCLQPPNICIITEPWAWLIHKCCNGLFGLNQVDVIRAWCWKTCHPALPTWYCNTNHTLPDRWHDSHTLGPNLLFQSCQMKELWLPVTKPDRAVIKYIVSHGKCSNIWLHGGCTEIVRRSYIRNRRPKKPLRFSHGISVYIHICIAYMFPRFLVVQKCTAGDFSCCLTAPLLFCSLSLLAKPWHH